MLAARFKYCALEASNDSRVGDFFADEEKLSKLYLAHSPLCKTRRGL